MEVILLKLVKEEKEEQGVRQELLLKVQQTGLILLYLIIQVLKNLELLVDGKEVD